MRASIMVGCRSSPKTLCALASSDDRVVLMMSVSTKLYAKNGNYVVYLLYRTRTYNTYTTPHVERDNFFAIKLRRIARRGAIANSHRSGQLTVAYARAVPSCTTGLHAARHPARPASVRILPPSPGHNPPVVHNPPNIGRRGWSRPGRNSERPVGKRASAQSELLECKE